MDSLKKFFGVGNRAEKINRAVNNAEAGIPADNPTLGNPEGIPKPKPKPKSRRKKFNLSSHKARKTLSSAVRSFL